MNPVTWDFVPAILYIYKKMPAPSQCYWGLMSAYPTTSLFLPEDYALSNLPRVFSIYTQILSTKRRNMKQNLSLCYKT